MPELPEDKDFRNSKGVEVENRSGVDQGSDLIGRAVQVILTIYLIPVVLIVLALGCLSVVVSALFRLVGINPSNPRGHIPLTIKVGGRSRLGSAEETQRRSQSRR